MEKITLTEKSLENLNNYNDDILNRARNLEVGKFHFSKEIAANKVEITCSMDKINQIKNTLN